MLGLIAKSEHSPKPEEDSDGRVHWNQCARKEFHKLGPQCLRKSAETRSCRDQQRSAYRMPEMEGRDLNVCFF